MPGLKEVWATEVRLYTEVYIDWSQFASTQVGVGAHLGFPIGTIFTIFDLQVTLILSTKFRVY